MGSFNERGFLLRALMAVFLVQFATVFYQIYSCQTAIKSPRDSDKVAVICSNASSSFTETGKLALTTFLALLVPSASQTVSGARNSRKKVTPEDKKVNDEGTVG